MALPPPLVIGIAGGTASGKTTVARRIVEGLAGTVAPAPVAAPPSVAFLDQDSYYRELDDLSLEERRAFNWDHPEAFDLDLLLEHVRALKAWQPVQKPVYSFAAYAREPVSVPVTPGRVLVIEGILVLGIEALRRELDMKLFVDTEDDVRVIRRLQRDIKERGRDFDSVVDQYFRTVRPMHQGFVEPSKRWADIVIPHGGRNETAIQMVIAALRDRLERGRPALLPAPEP